MNYSHKIANQPKLEGTLKDDLVQTWEWKPRWNYLPLSLILSWKLPVMGSLPHPWREAVAGNDHLHYKNVYLMLRWNHFWYRLYPLPLVFSMWLLWRESLHPLSSSMLHTGILLWGSSWAFFSPGRKGLILSVFCQKACFITLWSFLWPFFGVSLVCLHLTWIVGMRTEYGTADVAREMLSRVGWWHPYLC